MEVLHRVYYESAERWRKKVSSPPVEDQHTVELELELEKFSLTSYLRVSHA